jgi:hypothetical protein
MLSDLAEYLWAVLNLWASASLPWFAIRLYEGLTGKKLPIPRRIFAVAAAVCMFAGTFQTWRAERGVRRDFQHQLADRKSSERFLTEVPEGESTSEDGIHGNHEFLLSRSPADPTQVRVYMGGLKMKYGTDYRVEGRKLIFAIERAPIRGDWLEVEY